MADDGELDGKTDPARAFGFYKQAAQHGQAAAETAAGLAYYTGRGVAQDLTAARTWFTLAARQRDADAMFDLGVMLAKGEGGEADPVLAYAWFTLAGRMGVANGATAAAEIAARLTPDQTHKADALLNGGAAQTGFR